MFRTRFELQLAENRRLQQNFSALKAESSQTNKKLVCMNVIEIALTFLNLTIVSKCRF